MDCLTDERVVRLLDENPVRSLRRLWLRAAVLLLLLGSAFSPPQGLGAEEQEPHQAPGDPSVPLPAPVFYDVALLVNVGSLLFDLEGYGGGIGLKVGRDEASLRFLVNLHIHSLTPVFQMTLGTIYERRFVSGAVSPYWGVGGTVGIATLRDVNDSGDGASDTSLPFGVAGLLGVELSLTENIRVFIEYALAVELAVVRKVETFGGITTRDTYLEFRVDTGLGNQSMIGLAIYLPAQLRLQRRIRQRSADS